MLDFGGPGVKPTGQATFSESKLDLLAGCELLVRPVPQLAMKSTRSRQASRLVTVRTGSCQRHTSSIEQSPSFSWAGVDMPADLVLSRNPSR